MRPPPVSINVVVVAVLKNNCNFETQMLTDQILPIRGIEAQILAQGEIKYGISSVSLAGPETMQQCKLKAKSKG